jgi:trehalose/maltose hydrolase-like predicted phosphorylase
MNHDAKVGKSEMKTTARDFLNETFALLFKDHKEAVNKYFNVVEVKGDKNCPSLLRYEFYRLLKEINPLTFERD